MRNLGKVALANRYEKIRLEIHRLQKRVDEFNDYGELDIEMQTQYVQDVRNVLKRLVEVESDRAWINEEERLYQMPITKYLEIDEIKSLIDPFNRLFNIVLKYFKSEKR